MFKMNANYLFTVWNGMSEKLGIPFRNLSPSNVKQKTNRMSRKYPYLIYQDHGPHIISAAHSTCWFEFIFTAVYSQKEISMPKE